jgi:hypothetical protein
LRGLDDTPEAGSTDRGGRSGRTVAVAPGGRTLHRPARDGTGVACETVASRWETLPAAEVPANHRPCSLDGCASYLADLELENDRVTGGRPAWLTDHDRPVVVTAGGDALHRPDGDSPEPAPACRMHAAADSWRVVELTGGVAAFHTACGVETCREYLADFEAFDDLTD